MSSVPSKLEHKDIDALYHKNQIKSISFLIALCGLLLVAILLSLRAGSYNTPIVELMKGLFGKSADKKINLIVQNNRLPRILTAILAGGGLGLAGCVLQAVLRNPLASASDDLGNLHRSYNHPLRKRHRNIRHPRRLLPNADGHGR